MRLLDHSLRNLSLFIYRKDRGRGASIERREKEMRFYGEKLKKHLYGENQEMNFYEKNQETHFYKENQRRTFMSESKLLSSKFLNLYVNLILISTHQYIFFKFKLKY